MAQSTTCPYSTTYEATQPHTDNFNLPHACPNGALNKNRYEPEWRSAKAYKMASNIKRRKTKRRKLFGTKILNRTSLASQSTLALICHGILGPAPRRSREIRLKSCLLSDCGRAILLTLFLADCNGIRGRSSRRSAWGASGVREKIWS